MQTNKIDLGTQTIRSIMQYIDDHHLKDGDQLPTENQWRTILKCGRSTIREAMQVLAHSGAVVIKQGAGTFVQQQISRPEQQFQLRLTIKMLEDEAIREMLTHEINDDDWLLLKAHLSRRNQLLEDGQFDEYIDADLAFHQHVVQLSGNHYLIQWYQELQVVWKVFISNLVINKKQYRGNTDLHDQLFEALIQRHVDEAVRLNNCFGK